MLEMGSGLATWALQLPPDSPGPIPAEALSDHRPAYLDYEGPVSGDRGSVTRWDQGSYQLQHHGPSERVALLAGEKLNGRATLRQSPERPDRWQFSFEALSPPAAPR